MRIHSTFDDALMNALHGTINTIGECNVNCLLLDIIRDYLTFHQVWSKIEARLGDKAVRGLATETQVGLFRYSVTIKLCDSYCLSIGLDKLVAQ